MGSIAPVLINTEDRIKNKNTVKEHSYFQVLWNCRNDQKQKDNNHCDSLKTGYNAYQLPLKNSHIEWL